MLPPPFRAMDPADDLAWLAVADWLEEHDQPDRAELAFHPLVVEVTGKAGTVILFDTCGIHQQGTPILEPRQAVFLNYHHPDVRLQAEDVAYYRYHPLLLNAAFLGGLTEEDQSILGFGNKVHYQEHSERVPAHRGFRWLSSRVFDMKLTLKSQAERITARLRKIAGKR